VREPRDRAHHEPHLPQGDVHECPHESGVELRAGTARNLLAALYSGRRLLVRARRSDHVENVRNRDDPARERDLGSSDSPWVALAVPALVVVPHSLGPFAEPFAKRFHQNFAGQRMELDLLPLLVSRLARLVQDVRAHLELPDVVQ
jgi:hypothetical protein